MKTLFLVLGILFTLTSESFSNEKDELGMPFSQSGQDEALDLPESDKSVSSLDTPIPDWLRTNGKPLTTNESLAMPRSLTFPNWVQNGGNPINRPPEKTKAQPAGQEVFLTADHMTHDNNRNLFWAWGKVIIRFDDRVIRADKVKVNNKTGNGKATGHVIITQDDGTRLKSQKALFNINNQQGKLFETRGRLGKKYYIKVKEITRFSKSHYQAQKGHLTTCQGKLPDWLFEAESMDIIMGDRVLFTKGVFKVRNIPILYIPIGYLPLDQERKSGLLIPSFGNGSIGGASFNNAYYWAINGHSDATFGLDFSEQRGFKPSIEYRYTPNSHTTGSFNASFIDDKATDSTFWKVDAIHKQTPPHGFKFSGKLDLESEEFNRNFNDSTSQRARRNSDSHATITKNWGSSSLDILTRYQDSSQSDSDQTFAQLPQITYKTQRHSIGDTDFFFNQDSSFTSFLTDLDRSPDVDDNFSVQRFDFHPRISYTARIAPWLTLTPTLGLRETIYSKGLDATDKNKRLGFFTRESFDVSASLRGPRFEKIFDLKNKYVPKVKHLIEPRITYNYIPDLDKTDRGKIKVFDGIDTVNRQNTITYSLTQRILQKELEEDNFNTREVLRFDISQTIDLIEATGSKTSENKSPFSPLRFDLDSRLHDNLELNFDSTFDVHENVLKTFNVELGVKPIDSLYLFFERRFTRKETFLVGTVDWTLGEGWRIRGTTRFDEKEKVFRENNFSLLYDNPCKCWGFKFDIVERNNLAQGLGSGREVKYLLGITLRGLGSLSTGNKKKLIHREFESIK